MDNINNVSASEDKIRLIRQKMNEIIDNQPIANILGKDFICQFKEVDKVIENKSNEPFTLVILGEFKRGKSTILNAMLGKNLVPASASPETYTINEITYGNIRTVEAVLENGQKIFLSPDALKRDVLEKRMKLFPAKISFVRIKDPSPLLKEIRIVDTPGLSDLEYLDKQVMDYIINADAVIYAASALLPFSETEQDFMATHVQPQSFSMLYILVNMVDALNNQHDIDKVLRRVKGISERIVPNAFVYGISAVDELKRKLNEERPVDKGTRDFYESQFLQFELSLQRDIIMQKDVIRSKRVLSMLNRMWKETDAKLTLISDMTALDEKKLEQRSADFDIMCEDVKQAVEKEKPILHLSILEMQQEAENWMYEFFSKLRADILECRKKDENGEDIYSAEDIEKYFYSYLMEKVSEAYRTCIINHRDRIAQIVEKISRNLAKGLGMRELTDISKAPSVERIMMNLNKNVTRSVMGVKLFGTSETFPPATMSVFSVIFKKKRQTDVIDITLENFDEIRSNIVKDIKSVYENLEINAFTMIDGMCQYQMTMAREALSQAKEMVNQCDVSEISKILSQARNLMKEPEEMLKACGIESDN